MEWIDWINPFKFEMFPPLEDALSGIPVIGDPFKDEQKTMIEKLVNWKTGLIVGGLIYAWIRYRGGDQ